MPASVQISPGAERSEAERRAQVAELHPAGPAGAVDEQRRRPADTERGPRPVVGLDGGAGGLRGGTAEAARAALRAVEVEVGVGEPVLVDEQQVVHLPEARAGGLGR